MRATESSLPEDLRALDLDGLLDAPFVPVEVSALDVLAKRSLSSRSSSSSRSFRAFSSFRSVITRSDKPVVPMGRVSAVYWRNGLELFRVNTVWVGRAEG